MNQGRLVQTGAPAEIYERPASRFVADFVGEVNLFEGELTAGFNCLALAVAGFTTDPVALPAHNCPRVLRRPWRCARKSWCCLHAPPAGFAIAATVSSIGYLGGGSIVHLATEQGMALKAYLPGTAAGSLWPRHAGMGELAARERGGPDPMTGLGWIGRLVLIGVPFLWLALFFLLPLLIVVKISLAESTIGIPPYTPLFANDGGGLKLHATMANFVLIAGDDLYLRAYLGSLGNAALATALCLLIGYPVAYAIARSQGARRQLLLFLVMLPFWTSFLIRVYAWIAILEPNGLLNRVSDRTGVDRRAIAAPQ